MTEEDILKYWEDNGDKHHLSSQERAFLQRMDGIKTSNIPNLDKAVEDDLDQRFDQFIATVEEKGRKSRNRKLVLIAFMLFLSLCSIIGAWYYLSDVSTSSSRTDWVLLSSVDKMEYLHRHSDDLAIEDMYAQLLVEDHPNVRVLLIELIREQEASSWNPVLIADLLIDETSPNVQRAALEFLSIMDRSNVRVQVDQFLERSDLEPTILSLAQEL